MLSYGRAKIIVAYIDIQPSITNGLFMCIKSIYLHISCMLDIVGVFHYPLCNVAIMVISKLFRTARIDYNADLAGNEWPIDK